MAILVHPSQTLLQTTVVFNPTLDCSGQPWPGSFQITLALPWSTLVQTTLALVNSGPLALPWTALVNPGQVQSSPDYPGPTMAWSSPDYPGPTLDCSGQLWSSPDYPGPPYLGQPWSNARVRKVISTCDTYCISANNPIILELIDSHGLLHKHVTSRVVL